MAVLLTDIRCGCGGLCDSREPCPLASNVAACACGTRPTHSPKQHHFVLARYQGGYDDHE